MWTDVDTSASTVSLKDFDHTKDRLFIQYSEDRVSWSEIYTFHYNPVAQTWILVPDGASGNGWSVAACAVMMRVASPIVHLYETSYGGGIEFMHVSPFHPQALIIADLTVSSAASNNIHIDQFLILDARFGLGFRIPLTERLSLVPSVTYGVLTHMGNADFEDDGNSEPQWYLDQHIRGSLGLELMVTERMSIVIKPEAAMFFELNNNVGVLYGIGGGIRFGY
jgi:hypothetical protein